MKRINKKMAKIYDSIFQRFYDISIIGDILYFFSPGYPPTQFSCGNCQGYFDTIEELDKHMLTHLSTNKEI